jgi:hypothetical protein
MLGERQPTTPTAHSNSRHLSRDDAKCASGQRRLVFFIRMHAYTSYGLSMMPGPG